MLWEWDAAHPRNVLECDRMQCNLVIHYSQCGWDAIDVHVMRRKVLMCSNSHNGRVRQIIYGRGNTLNTELI